MLLQPPCINQSSDRFKVEQATVESRGTIGAVRVPLTAIRGLGPETAQHSLAVRAAFGDYTSLLDFCRKVDRRVVSRHDVLLLIKLGAFGFTGLNRAQLAAAEQYYTSLADTVGVRRRRSVRSQHDRGRAGLGCNYLNSELWTLTWMSRFRVLGVFVLTRRVFTGSVESVTQPPGRL